MTDNNQPNLLQFFQRRGAAASARTTASTSSSPAAIQPSDNVDDVQELDIDGHEDIFEAVGRAVNEDDIIPQPELHTTPNANEGSQAVAGGDNVEALNAGSEQENMESDAAEGLNVEVSVFHLNN